MGFMLPVASRFIAYRVETDCGTEIVPEDACGALAFVDGELAAPPRPPSPRNWEITSKERASNRSSA